MIRLIQDETELLPWAGDPIGARACAAAAAYGIGGHAAQFWRQNGDTLLCRVDDAMLLCAGSDPDWNELESFFPMAGGRVLLCRAGDASHLHKPESVTGQVMLRHGTTPEQDAEAEENPSPRELHALLVRCETETFHTPEFEPFYLDLSHRTRHGTALSVAFRRDGKLTAAAFCTARTDRLAILSGVAVLPEYRRQGLGRRVVHALLAKLSQPAQCVYRAQGEHKQFYEHLGFLDAFAFAELALEP